MLLPEQLRHYPGTLATEMSLIDRLRYFGQTQTQCTNYMHQLHAYICQTCFIGTSKVACLQHVISSTSASSTHRSYTEAEQDQASNTKTTQPSRPKLTARSQAGSRHTPDKRLSQRASRQARLDALHRDTLKRGKQTPRVVHLGTRYHTYVIKRRIHAMLDIPSFRMSRRRTWRSACWRPRGPFY